MAELRASLDHASEPLATLQLQLADRERDLARAERAAAESSQWSTQTAAGERDRRAERDKIDELQALIREGNAERADLRRSSRTPPVAGPVHRPRRRQARDAARTSARQ